MVAAVYKVSYRLRKKGATSGFQDLSKEVPIDDEIFKKNYNKTELTRIFASSISIYHPNDSIEILGFHKISDKNTGTEDREGYTNIWNFSKKNEVVKEKPSEKRAKPSRSIWRSPTWMIPFRIIWYIIKKIFSIAGWLMEGKNH
jgi:hypothetical protein